MKSLFKLFFISILFFNIMFTISCGLPDITSIYQEMNQPFITKLIPGPNKVTVEFQAQNNEPAFSGYNIYFGESVNPQKYKLYNQQKTRPTIINKNSQNITTYTYTIEPRNSYYSTGGDSEVTTLQESDIQNGIPIYVWVSAYQITPQHESIYYFDYAQMATPRPESRNQTVSSSSGNITLSGKTLATVGAGLTFQNNTGGIQSRSASSLDEVTIPPTNGYSTAALTVQQSQLYLTRTIDNGTNYYGKIFVRSLSGTSSAIVDYAIQTSGNILSY